MWWVQRDACSAACCQAVRRQPWPLAASIVQLRPLLSGWLMLYRGGGGSEAKKSLGT